MQDTSNRTPELYAVIKPLIKPEFTFLDIGCGFLPLYLGTSLASAIQDDFPEAGFCGLDSIPKVIEWCKARHPHYEWVHTLAEEFEVERGYDFVIYTGIDKAWSNAWKLNIKLLESGTPPEFVLLEAGEAAEIIKKVAEIYYAAGYTSIVDGSFVWDMEGINTPQRVYMVLRRGGKG